MEVHEYNKAAGGVLWQSGQLPSRFQAIWNLITSGCGREPECSEEFAKYMEPPTRHGLKQGWFRYEEVGGQGTSTRIIEVLEGPGKTAT